MKLILLSCWIVAGVDTSTVHLSENEGADVMEAPSTTPKLVMGGFNARVVHSTLGITYKDDVHERGRA